MQSIVFLLSFPHAFALFCRHLERTERDYPQELPNKTEDCSPFDEKFCVTHLLHGTLRMGCLRTGDAQELKALCRLTAERQEDQCDFEGKVDTFFEFGRIVYAVKGGNASCCCQSQICNKLLPFPFLRENRADLAINPYRKTFRTICLLLFVGTILGILTYIEGAIEINIIRWYRIRRLSIKREMGDDSTGEDESGEYAENGYGRHRAVRKRKQKAASRKKSDLDVQNTQRSNDQNPDSNPQNLTSKTTSHNTSDIPETDFMEGDKLLNNHVSSPTKEFELPLSQTPPSRTPLKARLTF